MPYTIEWLLQEGVLLLTAEENFTIEEFEEFSERVVNEFLHSMRESVYIIAEFSRVTQHSINVNRISKAANRFIQHPNVKSAIIVTDNRLLAFISSIVTKLGGVEVYITENYSKAIENLERLNPNLNLP